MDKSIYIACQEFGVRLTTGEAQTSAALEDMGLGRGPSVGTASVEVRPAVSREALEGKAQTLEVRGGKTRSERQAKKRSEEFLTSVSFQVVPSVRGLRELDEFETKLRKSEGEAVEVKRLVVKTTPKSATEFRNPANFGLNAGADADAALLWRDLGFPNSTAPPGILPA
eukprot:scaffold4146_cov124-Pinguiococcus_pyrenoidosus.AAC.1